MIHVLCDTNEARHGWHPASNYVYKTKLFEAAIHLTSEINLSPVAKTHVTAYLPEVSSTSMSEIFLSTTEELQ